MMAVALSQPVVVINPNCLVHVTEAIARAVGGTLQPADAPRAPWSCVTLAQGPAGIVTQADADRAAVLVHELVAANAETARGFIIACFSDPGILAARQATPSPVLGVGEAGLLAALAAGERVGVVAIASAAMGRHLRYWRQLGLERRVAAERALDLPVAQSGDRQLALGRMIEVARMLRDVDGADVLLLGCAGMADLREPLEQAVGLPVIDPCQAAAALMRLRLQGG